MNPTIETVRNPERETDGIPTTSRSVVIDTRFVFFPLFRYSRGRHSKIVNSVNSKGVLVVI